MEFPQDAGAVACAGLAGADLELTLQLDELLYPETTAVGQNTVLLDWKYQFMKASAVYNSETAVMTISLKADQKDGTGETDDLASVLSNPLSLTSIQLCLQVLTFLRRTR